MEIMQRCLLNIQTAKEHLILNFMGTGGKGINGLHQVLFQIWEK